MKAREKPLIINYRRPTLLRSTSCFFFQRKKYIPDIQVGQGSFGVVRRFVREDGDNTSKKFAVKSAISRSELNILDDIAALKREEHFWNKVYPHQPAALVEKGNEFRLITPFINGTTLYQLTGIKAGLDMKLKALIAAAKSLHYDIHEKGVIHGDIRPSNIIIDIIEGEYHATFIDFGLAYLSGAYGTKFAPTRLSAIDSRYAPEREISSFNSHLKGHPSQDVFSFGAMLMDDFPILCERRIFDILEQTQYLTAENRPTMLDLIAGLEKELECQLRMRMKMTL